MPDRILPTIIICLEVWKSAPITVNINNNIYVWKFFIRINFYMVNKINSLQIKTENYLEVKHHYLFYEIWKNK